jgi:hypothetical protein
LSDLLFLAGIHLSAKDSTTIGCHICVNPGTEETHIGINPIESGLKQLTLGGDNVIFLQVETITKTKILRQHLL